MTKKLKFLTGSLLVASAFLFTQCQKSDDEVFVDPYVLKLKTSATLGDYLVDKAGNTLYFFANDANGANNCTGGCIANWPIFNVTDLTVLTLGSGLNLADFANITSANGPQLTYKGWPLYYYAPAGVREASGQTSGEGVGNIWFVAKPDYTIMMANLQLVGANTKSYVVSATNVYTEGTGATKYFTDNLGRTLYIYAPDLANTNKWTTTDEARNAIWPIYETDKIVVPSTLDKTLFGSITVAAVGKKQLTYKGWPMYYFRSDVDVTTGNYRGFNKGISVGINAAGTTPSKWPILFKDMPAAL